MVLKVVLNLLLVSALGLLLACGSEGEKAEQVEVPDKYEGWQTYLYENVRFIYPPNFPLVDSLDDMARQYIAAIERNCRFFEMEVPRDTLVIYHHTGYRQGREMTGRQYPFADSSAIHFWLPSFPGVTLMQWLLPRWQPIEPRYMFLKHGLLALLDYSGQNYHVSTVRYIEEDRFIPLAELAVDTTVDSDTERHQTALAASFVDFISFYYGIKALEVLYRAQAPFENAIQGIFMMPVDSLQQRWIDFAKERAAEWEVRHVSDST
ncbi:MAG: hypothetical protein AB1744_01385 [Candidatus Zixiibacteriota bacterium]